MSFIYIYESKFFYAILNCLLRIYRCLWEFIDSSSFRFEKRLLSVRLLASVGMIECWEAESSQKLSFADLTWIEICCFKFSNHVRRYFFWINESYYVSELLVASVDTQFAIWANFRNSILAWTSCVRKSICLESCCHQLCFIFKNQFVKNRLRITARAVVELE